jgi:signal transduction histidine kinase
LSQIGSIKKEQKNADESIEYFKEALVIAREMNDQNMVSSVLNNIGSAYKQLGEYGVAKEYFLQAIQINKTLNNRRNLSYNYNNLANVFEETGNLHQALEYQQKSIVLKTDLNDQPMLATSYYNLALIYVKLDSFAQAKVYILRSKKLAKQFKVASIIPLVFSEYSRILAREDDHQKAYLILSELDLYRDSLDLANKEEEINEMESAYRRQSLMSKRAKKDREFESSESNNFQRNIMIFLFSLFTVFLILLFGLYFLSYRKRSESTDLLNLESERMEALTDKLRTQNSRIDDITGRLELLQRDKNIYFSSVSHDMRGPLNAISAILELLKDRPDLKGSEEILVLDYSTRSLIALVEDILDVSYLEAGKLQIEHKTFSLRDLIQALIDSFEFISNEKEIDLILDVGSIPDPLVGDPKRINQILFNLLENAFKFTKDGFVKISVQSNSNALGQQDIVIEIEDSGIGIANSKLDLIFDKFYRASGEAYKDFGGSGIGLFVSQALILQMSGTLDVKSSVGEGSLFTLKLTLPKG